MPIKHYVEFLYPGFFFPEHETKEVPDRDPKKIEVPDGCFAFCFFDMMVEEVNGRTLTGEVENQSGRYYPEAEVYTRKDVVEKVADNRILLSNMDGNGWKKIVKTRMGNMQPFNKNDVILD